MPNTNTDPSNPDEPSEAASGSNLCVFAPWPLITVAIEASPDDGSDDIVVRAGGQGVWVARMAASLGARVILVGPFGGKIGRAAAVMLRDEGIAVRSVDVAGSNGAYIHDRRGGERAQIAEMRPARLDRHEVDDLLDALLTEGMRCGTVALTGLRDGEVFDPALYGTVVRDLAANGVEIIADVAGAPLKAIDQGIGVLKISHEEMVADGYATDGSWSAIAAGMDRLVDRARDIVVSCAARGTLARFDGKFWLATPPNVTPRDHTGAGDSMTGGLAVARTQGLSVSDALRLATAAGALNVTRRGRGTGAAMDVDVFRDHVKVREVDPADLDLEDKRSAQQ